jgi:TPR repeat protein
MSATDLDDAAFRARLAPLSQAVLPAGSGQMPAPDMQDSLRPALRRRFMVRAGLTAACVLLAAGWACVQHPPFSLRAGADAPSSVPSTQAVPAPPAAPSAAEALSAAPSAAAVPPDNMVGILLRRGDAALAAGDITAARLLYERAAALGSAVAATDAGNTYDIAFLLEIGARGTQADQGIAAAWYRKAAALGDPQARERLRRMEDRKQP